RLADDLRDQTLEPVAPAGPQQVAQVNVFDERAERSGDEELERLEVPDQLDVRLGQGRVVDGRAAGSGTGEADLLGEDRLAGARHAGQQDDVAALEATVEHEVEA